ncbi:MAG TPA: YceI family protein [Solirubrobacteraceae bacterium]|nr:YceI family protein [Solirubrobacteraceae bacterium]
MSIDTTAAVPVGTWRLDPIHSSASFSVKHMVVATFRGRFDEFDVTLVSDESGARLSGTVEVDSLVVKDEKLAGHMRSPDFFDLERHPQITFESTAVRRDGDDLYVDGELTVKGNTHPVQAKGTITDPVVGLGDSERLGIDLETVVDRHKFGLDWNAPLPKGGTVLADEVKLHVELELTKA